MCAATKPAMSAGSYIIQDLGPLWANGGSGAANSLNNFGEIVGIRSNSAFLYSAGQTISIDTGGSANGINDQHQVVGVSSSNRGFLYENGVMRDLGDLGYGGDVVATGINNTGQITGYASGTTATHAFLYTNGAMQDISQGGAAFARGINDHGEVVGSLLNSRAFLYSGGITTDLGTLGGTASVARGINNEHVMVGDSYIAGNTLRHAFVYKNGQMQDMTPSLNRESFAYGINDAGDIVGTVASSSLPQYAFLYLQGALVDLNLMLAAGSGWELTNAADINDLGQIAGAGYLNGEYHAFLLSPVPELSGLLQLSFGLFCVYSAVKTRR
jgi:probable HAF family extracellular repeat protein